MKNLNRKQFTITITDLFVYFILPTFLLSSGILIYKFTIIFPLIMIIIFITFFARLKISYIPFDRKYLFFTGFTLLSGISLLRATSFDSYDEFFHILSGFTIILLMHNLIDDEKKIKKVIKITKIVILFLCIQFIIAKTFNFNHRAIYSNENRLTTFLVFFSPFIFSEILSRKNISNILLLSIIIITCFIAGSRFNLLAISIQMFIFFIVIIIRLKFKQKKFTLIISVILILIISIPLFQIISITGDQNLSEQRNTEASSLLLRVYLIVQGLQIIQESHYMGVGAGNIIIPNYWTRDKEKWALHNFFIHLVATYGIIALLIFLFMYYQLYKDYRFIYSFRNKIETNFFEVALLMFLITFLISSNSPSSLFELRPFYFVFGLIFVKIRSLREKIYSLEY
ncbi:MAG: O-antigen ligase family protein [Candidatus Cloacimonetes bacterium]|nr:O-antigen ligase family protein [Candidatus Cloacimonadota bacterium]